MPQAQGQVLGYGGEVRRGDVTPAEQLRLRKLHTPAIHLLAAFVHLRVPGHGIDRAAQRLRRWADVANERIALGLVGGGEAGSDYDSLPIAHLRELRVDAELGAKFTLMLLQDRRVQEAHARIIATLDHVNEKRS